MTILIAILLPESVSPASVISCVVTIELTYFVGDTSASQLVPWPTDLCLILIADYDNEAK